MNNPVISDRYFVQIIRFHVASGGASTLLTSILEEVDRWVVDCDGFISANFHISEDGEHLINYAQWRDKKAFQAFTKNSEQSRLQDIISAANVEHVEADGFILRQSVVASNGESR